MRHLCDTHATLMRHSCDTYATLCDTYATPHSDGGRGYEAARLMGLRRGSSGLSPLWCGGVSARTNRIIQTPNKRVKGRAGSRGQGAVESGEWGVESGEWAVGAWGWVVVVELGAWREKAMSSDDRAYGALADTVRGAREARGLSQRGLSRGLGMSDGYVGHLESGRFSPTVGTLRALSSALGVSYWELLGLAGYVSADELEGPADEDGLARLNEVSDLTEGEWESVREFARSVRFRRGQG